jgi:NADH:ubiquinone oxidoreductase subunit 5 (subunit L)/multisubunit Na+/H+ antiporter MnhA subunit
VSITAFFAATTSTAQNDIKKIIAYSNLQSIGYMVLACGLSGLCINYVSFGQSRLFLKLCFFYVLVQVIHALQDEQRSSSNGGI